MKWIYSLQYHFFSNIFLPFLCMEDMIPVLEVTPMVQSVPQES